MHSSTKIIHKALPKIFLSGAGASSEIAGAGEMKMLPRGNNRGTQPPQEAGEERE